MATITEIEEMLVGALAKQKRCTPAELRADLLAKGGDMPADSHRLVRAVAKIQKELGIKFKWNKDFRPAFKSVGKLARFLHEHQSDMQQAA